MRSRAFTLPPSRIALISRSTSADRLEQRALAAVGAAEDVALAEDGDFDLLHPTLLQRRRRRCRRRRRAVGLARQALEQHVDPAARGVQARAQVVAFGGDRGELRRAASALVRCSSSCRSKQALDPVGEFLDRGHGAPAAGEVANCRVGLPAHALLRIAIVGAREGVHAVTVKREAGTWCARAAQTALPPQRYGGRSGCRVASARAHMPLGARRFREGRPGRSASPDTGQQAGPASAGPMSQAPAGKRARAACSKRSAMFHRSHSFARAERRLRSSRHGLLLLARRAVGHGPDAARSGRRHRHARARGRSAAARADLVVIDADAIRAARADSVEDLLRREAGMQLVRATAARARATGFFIRGAGTSSTRRAGRRRARRLGDARPGRARGAEPRRRSSASRCCAVRARACTAPTRSAAWCRSSPGAASGAPRVTARTRRRRLSARAEGDVGVERSQGRVRLRGSRSAARAAAASRRSAPDDAFGNFNPDRDGYSRNTGSLRLGYTPAAGHRIGVRVLETRLHAQYDSRRLRSRHLRHRSARPTSAAG